MRGLLMLTPSLRNDAGGGTSSRGIVDYATLMVKVSTHEKADRPTAGMPQAHLFEILTSGR
jgi:hypothetical protein